MFIEPSSGRLRPPSGRAMYIEKGASADALRPVRRAMSKGRPDEDPRLKDGPPDGGRLLTSALSINMALLTECCGAPLGVFET